jgi:hypothetical protein
MTVDSTSGLFIGISTATHYLVNGDVAEANTNDGSSGMALVSSKGELK